MEPGAWAGSVIHLTGDQVYVLVSQDRWDKSKMMIAWLLKEVQSGEDVPFKQLESYIRVS